MHCFNFLHDFPSPLIFSPFTLRRAITVRPTVPHPHCQPLLPLHLPLSRPGTPDRRLPSPIRHRRPLPHPQDVPRLVVEAEGFAAPVVEPGGVALEAACGAGEGPVTQTEAADPAERGGRWELRAGLGGFGHGELLWCRVCC